MSLPGPSADAALPDERRGATRTAWLAAPAVVAAALIALLGVAAATHGTGELPVHAAGTTTLLRAIVFAALAVHLGELAGARFARAPSHADRPRPAPRPLSAVASLVGAGACAGQLLLLCGVSGLNAASAYSTVQGRLLLVMANGFLLAAGCAAIGRPGWALAPLAAVLGAEALRAHPEQSTPLIGAALTVVHLTAASLWAGGLLHVLRVLFTARGDRPYAKAVLSRYARRAGWLPAALAATGTASALRKLPFEVALTSAYGRVLLVKLALVGAASALALGARRRLRRTGRAGREAYLEVTVLAVVVLVSAVLTVVPNPGWHALAR
ncbi:CopD family protein [Streptomyces sp. NRRL F-5126]|uniref:CopD family protein n=1 Tax=Streptomyces sp. NRRL F-5126 TaxID=1463857 RepID=UPI000A8D62BE|nr:CopD family protein [Streptomyces sp. NRRL F-5126]